MTYEGKTAVETCIYGGCCTNQCDTLLFFGILFQRWKNGSDIIKSSKKRKDETNEKIREKLKTGVSHKKILNVDNSRKFEKERTLWSR
jgi:hypothetical protein